MNAKDQEFPNKTLSFNKMRERYRVEIKKHTNTEVFNSKRLKFTEKVANVQLNETNTVFASNLVFDENLRTEIINSIKNQNNQELLKKMKQIRVQITTEAIDFQRLSDSKIIPILINICKTPEFQDFEELIYETTWIILNGLSGESKYTREFIEEGVIDALKLQINSENLRFREQALWAFSNIAGDEDTEIKKMLFKEKIVENVCDVATTFPLSDDFKSHLSSFIINLSNVEEEIDIDFKDVEIFLNVIYYLLTSEDGEIEIVKELIQATYHIFNLAQFNNDYLEQIIEYYFPLVNLIMKEIIPKYEKHKIILHKSIKCLSILLSGYDSTIEDLMKNDIVSLYAHYLTDYEHEIRKDIMWGLSNVACCESPYIELLFTTPFLLKNIIDLTSNDVNMKVKKEGLICLTNLCNSCSQEQSGILVKNGCIDLICSFISIENIELLDAILNGLEGMLYHGREIKLEHNYADNPYWIYLEEKKYLEKLENLIMSSNSVSQQQMDRVEQIINAFAKDETEKN